MKWRVAAVFLAVGAIWGSAWIPMSTLSQTLPGFTIGALRFGLAAVAVAVAALVIQAVKPVAKRRFAGTLKSLAIPGMFLGAAMLAGPYALTLWAGKRVSPGVVALVFGFMPLLVLLINRDERSDEARRGAIPAVVLGIGGVAMVVQRGLSFSAGQAAGTAALLAAMVLGGISLVYVCGLFEKGKLRRDEVLILSAIQLGTGGVLLAMGAAASGELSRFEWPWSGYGNAALPLALLAIVVSGATLPMLYWLLQRTTAWQAATLQWAATLVAVAEAAWITGGRPAPAEWLGAILIPACTLQLFFGFREQSAVTVTEEITEHTFRHRKASDSMRKSE